MKNDRSTLPKKYDQTATILIIADKESIREGIAAYLKDDNFHVVEAANGRTGLESARHENPALILIGLHLPEMSGLELLTTIHHEFPQTPFIVLSAKEAIADAVEALHLGAWDCISLPVHNMSLLLHSIRKALEQTRLIHENRRYREHLEEEISQRTKELREVNEALLWEITAYKQKEQELRESEDRFQTLLWSLDDVVWMALSKSTKTPLYINPAAERLYGRPIAEFLENPDLLVKVVHPDDQGAVIRHSHELQSELEYRIIRPDGEVRWVHDRKSVVYDEMDSPIRIGGIVTDITERKRTEADISRLQHFMKDIIDSMPSILIGVDLEGRVTHWNLQAEKTTGILSGKAQGCLVSDVFPQLRPHMGQLHRAIQQRTPRKDEKVISRMNGESRYLDVTIYPLVSDGVDGAVIRVDDVTSRVRIEEMMIQSEKMIAVGGLAAGIAHELNNPLASMIQNTQVVLNRLTGALPANSHVAVECGITMEAIRQFVEQRDIVKMLEMVRISGEQAAQIVQDMLSFSHKSEYHIFTLHDITTILEKTVALALHMYDRNGIYKFRQIEILQEYAPDLPKVPCEQTEIQQVVLNLLMNAAQSMAEQETHTEALKIILHAVQDGNMVRIEVEDNGPGMPEHVCKRVFEPFFTTKEMGTGTGLGLSVSYFIITKNHDGTMSVESHPGKGTKVIICLPLTRGA